MKTVYFVDFISTLFNYIVLLKFCFGFTLHKLKDVHIRSLFFIMKFLHLAFLLSSLCNLFFFMVHFQYVYKMQKNVEIQEWRYPRQKMGKFHAIFGQLLIPENIYWVKVNNGNTKRRFKRCSKLTTKNKDTRTTSPANSYLFKVNYRNFRDTFF